MSITHIPFYPSDWLAGTRYLSAEESGVYIALISRMYEMAGPIERDDDRLHRLCGTRSKASFKKILDFLIEEGKIIITDDGIYQERVQKVIEKVIEKSSKSKQAAEARWSKKVNKNNNRGSANASPVHMPQPCQPKPKPKRDTNVSLYCAKSAENRFQEFWDIYPHRGGAKKGRKPSKQKYDAAVKRGISEQEIIDGAFRYQSDRKVLDGYGRNPETWLNQEGWTDEIEPKQFAGASRQNASMAGDATLDLIAAAARAR